MRIPRDSKTSKLKNITSEEFLHIHRVPRKFFFWGIFKDFYTLTENIETPIEFKKIKIQNKKGVLVDFSNLSCSEFLNILGRLAIFERKYYTLEIVYFLKEPFLYYLPVERSFDDFWNGV